MELNFDELRELISVINQTDVAEFTLKSGDFELVVRKAGAQSNDYVPMQRSVSVESLPSPPSPPSLPSSPSPSPTSFTPPPSPTTPPIPTEKFVDVTAQIVGTFYQSPSPDEPPFVSVGDRVRNGQVVCIIEAMKVMNEIEAEVSGEVVEILVKNAEPVEFGQVLMRVKPS